MAGRIGTESVSEWVEVSQEMIDKFADATGDHQFIHINPAMAAMTPFGGTIAHGFLTLSLMPLLSSKI
ncbi:MAG: MaoC family dehydratase, partial [Pseudomonadota bacterium]|nr:MaoC family dehydratase [Pseudomonadota bacterium]